MRMCVSHVHTYPKPQDSASTAFWTCSEVGGSAGRLMPKSITEAAILDDRHSHCVAVPHGLLLAAMALDPARTLAELRELQALTGDERGAQRVCWTETWARARELVSRAARGAARTRRDGRGRQPLGDASRAPPNARSDRRAPRLGLERRLARRLPERAGRPRGGAPCRGGRAARGDGPAGRLGRRGGLSLRPQPVRVERRFAGASTRTLFRELRDASGAALPDVLAGARRRPRAGAGGRPPAREAAAYLELHIEQGPVLERRDVPLAVVLGTYGVERHVVRFTGQRAHVGATPMDMRRDSVAAAARLVLEGRRIAEAAASVTTVGTVATPGGIVTAVAPVCELVVDQRNLDAETLAAMLSEAQECSRRIAEEEGCEVAWEPQWRIPPRPFHPQLIELRATRPCARRPGRRTGCRAARCTTRRRWRARAFPR